MRPPENESQETFTALFNQHLAKFKPANDVELAAVEEMTASTCRLRRLWAIETNLLNRAMETSMATTTETEIDEHSRLGSAFAQLAAGPELHLLDRYETRLHRMYHRSLQNFLLLRNLDDENPQPPEEPASEQPVQNQEAEPPSVSPVCSPEPSNPEPSAPQQPARAPYTLTGTFQSGQLIFRSVRPT